MNASNKTPSVLKSPILQELVQRELRSFNRDGDREARALREALFTEPATTLDLLTALPELVNRAFRTATAVGEEVRDKATPALTREILEGLASELDTQAFEECASVWWPLIEGTWKDSPELRHKALDISAHKGAALLASFVNIAASRISGHRTEPDHLGHFAKELHKRLDWQALENASFTVVGQALDQKHAAFRWISRFVRHRRESKGS